MLDSPFMDVVEATEHFVVVVLQFLLLGLTASFYVIELLLLHSLVLTLVIKCLFPILYFSFVSLFLLFLQCCDIIHELLDLLIALSNFFLKVFDHLFAFLIILLCAGVVFAHGPID